MPTFQLDECLNDPDFAKECEDSAMAESISGILVKRLPNRLRSLEDDVVLADLLTMDGAILTKDRKIAVDHIDSIPVSHPGIIIIANAPGHAGTMTVVSVRRILAKFKSECKDWHTLPFRNSIIEITQIGINVSRKSGSALVRTAYVDFHVADWRERLVEALAANAAS